VTGVECSRGAQASLHPRPSLFHSVTSNSRATATPAPAEPSPARAPRAPMPRLEVLDDHGRRRAPGHLSSGRAIADALLKRNRQRVHRPSYHPRAYHLPALTSLYRFLLVGRVSSCVSQHRRDDGVAKDRHGKARAFFCWQGVSFLKAGASLQDMSRHGMCFGCPTRANDMDRWRQSRVLGLNQLCPRVGGRARPPC